jgi:hypothetical protein
MARQPAFYADLLESCSTFAAQGEVLLVGDVNSRVGEVAGHRASNPNGNLLLEFLRSAFTDGDEDQYQCLLNATFGHRGSCTFNARGQQSIVDYLVTSRESLHRVERVHVECNDQSLGANAIGSDHNLLYVGWKLHVDVPECMSATRTIWRMSDFEDAKIHTKYQQTLSAKLENWKSTCDPLLLRPGTEAQINSNVLDISYHLLVETIQNSLAETISVKTVGPDQRSYMIGTLRSQSSLSNAQKRTGKLRRNT